MLDELNVGPVAETFTVTVLDVLVLPAASVTFALNSYLPSLPIVGFAVVVVQSVTTTSDRSVYLN